MGPRTDGSTFTQRMLGAWRPAVVLAALFGLCLALAPAAGGQGAGQRAQKGEVKAVPAKVRRSLARQPRPVARVGRELVGLRTRTSRTYVNPRGGRVARIYPRPVHFRSRGKWRTIDSRLRRVGDRFINRANRYSVALPADIGSGPVRVRRGKTWVQFGLRGASGPATIRGGEAIYRDAFPGVDASYRAQSTSVKETFTLAGPGARRSFVFDLKVSTGLRPRVLRRRGLVIRDRRGATRLAFAAPYMIDAKRKESARVSLRLANVDGRWRLTMTASDAWLEQRGRAWPVKVDPYVYTEPDQDCRMNEDAPGTSFCGTDRLAVGTSTHGGATAAHAHNSAVRFPGLSAIPRDADVHYAIMSIGITHVETQDWVQSPARPLNQAWTGQATWNHADGVERWGEPGGDADTRPEHRSDTNAWIGPTATTANWSLTNMVGDWVSGRRPNHGLVFTAPANQYAELHATETAGNTDPSSNQGGEPRLQVEYTPRQGERRGWSFEEMKLSDRIGLKVNLASGNLLVSHTDFSMPGGLGPAIAVSRTYNSLNEQTSRLGRGWTLDTGHDVSLKNWGDGMIYQGPTAVQAGFVRRDGQWKTPAGFDTKLTQDSATGGHTITENSSQAKQRFDSSGRLSAVEDRNGRQVKYAYASSGSTRLTTIKAHADETKATLAYDASERLQTLTDAANRVTTYAYGSDGKLATVADPENGSANPTRYEYTGCTCRLSKITTPGGRITLIDYYPTGDPNAGKVKSIKRVTNTTDMTGPTWQFEYTVRRDGTGETHVIDPNGTATSDANDRIWRHSFDDQGRVTKSRDPLGRETNRKLTSTSKVESYTAAGNTGSTPNSTATYDADDNATGSDTPTGSGSIKDFADFGAADANPSDPAPSGYTGVPSGVQGSKYLPGRATNSQGGRTEFGWQDTGAADTNGNPHSVKQTTNDGTLVSGVTMNYAPTSSSIDGKQGQLASITDGRGHATSYGYDAKGNVSTVTPPDPGAPNPVGPTRMTYHAGLARVEKVQDGKDNWRLLSYDQLDRLTRIEFTGADQTLGASEPYVAYSYDRDGNQLTEESREQGTGTVRTRTMTYDPMNRVTYEALPGGASNTMTYDLVGNLRSLADAGGKVEYVYDAANQVRSIFEPGTTKPTKFEHNKDGQRTKTTYPNGVVIDQAYDQAQRLKEIHSHKPGATVPTLQKLAYAYQDPTTSRQTPLVFEKSDGKLGHTHRYAYDGLDRLTAATIKSSSGDWATNGTLAHYEYGSSAYPLDGAGNVVKRVVTGTQVPNSVTDFTYNTFNQLCLQQAGTSTSTPPTACPTSSSPPFAYDKNGNETAAPGRTVNHNLLDQTTNLTIAGSPTSLVYLGAGQDRWISEGGASFQHTVLGLTSRGSDRFTRDEGGKLVSRRNGTARHYYLFDALGSVTGLTDSAGAVSERYDYEPYGTPAPRGTGQWAATTGAADVGTGQFGFAAGYRSVGGLYHYGQRYYDPSNMRWTQTDPLDQTGDLREGNRYVYAASDPVGLSDPSGLITIGIDFEAQIGPIRASVGASIDDDGNVGVTAGGGGGGPTGGGWGFGGGVKGAVAPGKVENGGEIEGGGCVGSGLLGCGSVNNKGRVAGGVGVGTPEAGIAYRQTRRVADLW